MPIYELSSALISSAIVSPIMTILDTSIIRSQMTKHGFIRSYSNTIRDYAKGVISFRRPFFVMNGVYGSTYATANLTELFCKKNGMDHKIPTFALTSIVNILTIAYKDKEYSKIFDQKKNIFPKISYGLFALRDSMTIGSCFIIKQDVVSYLQHSWKIPHNTADLFASLFVPMTAQIFSTPIHIYSLDIYQRPNATFKERIENIMKMYHSVCFGRIIRIIPAFCIGGFINDMIRNHS
jgi:hypothetical protein